VEATPGDGEQIILLRFHLLNILYV